MGDPHCGVALRGGFVTYSPAVVMRTALDRTRTPILALTWPILGLQSIGIISSPVEITATRGCL